MDEELLTAAEIARRAGVHRSTVSDWIKSERLKPAQTVGRGHGKQLLFTLSAAQSLIDDAQHRTAAPDVLGGAASS